MSKFRLHVKKMLGSNLLAKIYKAKAWFGDFKLLASNTYLDAMLYYRHSMVFKLNTLNKVESQIILHYHGLEKGFLHDEFRYRFGKDRIIELVKLLRLKVVSDNFKKSQISAGYLALCKYYEKHQSNGVDISDYFRYEDYLFFKKLSSLSLNLVKTHIRADYFRMSDENFFEFSQSRSSVRNFTGEYISLEKIYKVIEIAKNAPSVCNRQPNKVYYLSGKTKIDEVLEIQQGLKGYSDKINQLFILATDRNYYYSVGERNQLFIDGGIFLMNILYALHYYQIGACPAHWGHNSDRDKRLQKVINFPDSEKVICIIAIGIPVDRFSTTLSLRRDNDEILKIVE